MHDCLDVQRHQGHRQHASLGAEQAAHPVQALDRVSEKLPQRDDQQVADSVVVQLTFAAETVLDHLAPRLPPLVVTAQRRQCHPEITGGKNTELTPQPAARPAVVGDGDDSGDVARHPAQRRERGSQAVPAAERHDPHIAGSCHDRFTLDPGHGARSRRPGHPWPTDGRSPR